MEPFEEFEFKPLTKGLGFHKKSAELKKQMLDGASLATPKSVHDLPDSKPMDYAEELVNDSAEPKTQKEAYADLLKALEKPMSFDAPADSSLEFSEPLPRKHQNIEVQASSIDSSLPDINMPVMPPMSDMPDIVENQQPEKPTFEQKKSELFSRTKSRSAFDSPKSKVLEPIGVGVAAGILDTIFVVALSLIFLVSLVLVTGVDISSVIFSSKTDLTTQISLAVLFVAVMQMYVIVARSFFGCSLGEWTFDMQMGDDDQHKSSVYPLLVLWRSALITLTGLIVFPLLSLIFRKDLAARLTGLQLYRQRG